MPRRRSKSRSPSSSSSHMRGRRRRRASSRRSARQQRRPRFASRSEPSRSRTRESPLRCSGELDQAVNGGSVGVEREVKVCVRNALTGSVWAELAVPAGCSVASLRPLLRAKVANKVPPNVGLRLLRPAIAKTSAVSARGSAGAGEVFLDGETIDGDAEVLLVLAKRTPLATASHDMSAALWDAGTDECCSVLWGHDGPVLAVAFSPDGRTLATGSADRSIRQWSGISGAWHSSLRGHRDSVLCLAFSRDSRWLISASRDKSARLWSVGAFGRCHMVLRGHSAAVTAVNFAALAEEVLTASEDGAVRIWRALDGALVAELRPPAAPGIDAGMANWACFSPDGSKIASAWSDGCLRLWTCRQDGRGRFSEALVGAPQTLVAHRGEVFCVAFAPMVGANGAEVRPAAPSLGMLASAAADGTCGVWEEHETGGWRLLATLRGHRGKVLAVDFSTDGSLLATGGQDREVRLWDACRWACARVLRGHSGGVASLAFGAVPASGGSEDDGEAGLRDP